MIRVRVNGTFSDILLDTGACQSVINYSSAQRLGARIENLRPGETQNLITADSAIIQTYGAVTLTLQFGHLKVNHRFLVMKNCSSGIICGLDFIVKNKVNCVHASGYASIQDGQASVPFIQKHQYLGVAYVAREINFTRENRNEYHYG